MNRTRVITTGLVFALAILLGLKFFLRVTPPTSPLAHVDPSGILPSNQAAQAVSSVATTALVASVGVTKTDEPLKTEFKDQTQAPMQAVFTDDQQRQLKAFEVKLNELTGKAKVIRQKMAAVKFEAIATDPAMKEAAARLEALEKSLRSAVQENAAMVTARKAQEDAHSAFSVIEAHQQSLETTGTMASASNDWITCPTCRAQVPKWPEHGPRTHEGLAGLAAENARRALLAASRNVVGVDRDLRANNTDIVEKLHSVTAARTELDTKLNSIPAVAGLAQEEARFLAEHAEIVAQCVKLHQSARREPIRLANPLEASAGGSGT